MLDNNSFGSITFCRYIRGNAPSYKRELRHLVLCLKSSFLGASPLVILIRSSFFNSSEPRGPNHILQHDMLWSPNTEEKSWLLLLFVPDRPNLFEE